MITENKRCQVNLKSSMACYVSPYPHRQALYSTMMVLVILSRLCNYSHPILCVSSSSLLTPNPLLCELWTILIRRTRLSRPKGPFFHMGQAQNLALARSEPVPRSKLISALSNNYHALPFGHSRFPSSSDKLVSLFSKICSFSCCSMERSLIA
uniref:ARAD1C26972p n=1 Tax=Blastobotrys adeninivorans TaxID=409370 RepID=A0A060T858_BLAAD